VAGGSLRVAVGREVRDEVSQIAQRFAADGVVEVDQSDRAVRTQEDLLRVKIAVD
jgi:hypothetical protein